MNRVVAGSLPGPRHAVGALAAGAVVVTLVASCEAIVGADFDDKGLVAPAGGAAGPAGTSSSGGAAGAAPSGAAGGGAIAEGGGGAAGAAGAMAEGGGGAAPCQCKQPGDTCIGTTCVKQAATCDAANECPPGYQCDASKQCVCSDLPSCGIQCGSGCPGELVCDGKTGVCRPPLMCMSDAMCGAAERCDAAWAGDYPYPHCRPAGAAPVGAPCAQHWDCVAGAACYGNNPNKTCASRCVRNEDCAGTLVCAHWQDFQPEVCAPLACGTCPPSGQCDIPYNNCIPTPCATGQDCAGGDCSAGLGWPQVCDGQQKCQPAEIQWLAQTNALYCVGLGGGCWTNADCTAPDTCVLASEMGPWISQAAGVCGEKVP